MRWQLLDRITECEPGVRAIGIKCFTRSEEFFRDHFPGMPIVPGVLQIEMIAQLAGKCIAMKQKNVLPVLGTVKAAKFYRNIRPGDQCIIKIEVTKIARAFGTANGVIEVDGQKMASAEIFFGMVDRSALNSESFDDVTKDFLAKKQLEEAKNNSSQDQVNL